MDSVLRGSRWSSWLWNSFGSQARTVWVPAFVRSRSDLPSGFLVVDLMAFRWVPRRIRSVLVCPTWTRQCGRSSSRCIRSVDPHPPPSPVVARPRLPPPVRSPRARFFRVASTPRVPIRAVHATSSVPLVPTRVPRPCPSTSLPSSLFPFGFRRSSPRLPLLPLRRTRKGWLRLPPRVVATPSRPGNGRRGRRSLRSPSSGSRGRGFSRTKPFPEPETDGLSNPPFPREGKGRRGNLPKRKGPRRPHPCFG